MIQVDGATKLQYCTAVLKLDVLYLVDQQI
jgi:hypothetical protein